MSSPADVRQTISRAGHDLNNACASMLGFSALTLDELEQDSPLRLYLTEISAAARRATRIAEELMALSLKI
jgi:signal transduction histidine kinase